jgi:cellulose synthase operon protein YhjQ
MTDHKPLVEQNETPDDVATLYSWANLHGAKYRDFSASRAQTREIARLRVQDALAKEQERAREQAKADSLTAGHQAAEAERAAEVARQGALAAEQAEHAEQESSARAAAELARQAAQESAIRAARERVVPAPAAPFVPPAAPSIAPATPAAPLGEEAPPQLLRRELWKPVENPGRPSYFEAGPSVQPAAPVPDPVRDSPGRPASRWFALKSVFDEMQPQVPPQAASVPSHAPVLAVFSLAGGVGKTSLVATLGRALSARGERVLLVDTAAFGLLPFFFGARDQRPGQLRTFTPPGNSADAPIQMVAIDPEVLSPETAGPAAQDSLTQEVARHSRTASRVIVDLATASGSVTRRVLRLTPVVLVPVKPDLNSVVSVGAIDSFFQKNSQVAGRQVLPYYVLNQFDASLPLHLDVREVLREQLGSRLLPFELGRSPEVSEALAEGMTVMDYAPHSPVAEGFAHLAAWINSIAPPASPGYRGVRWSER